MKKLKKVQKLDLLFDWFVKTEQCEELRKSVLESVGLKYTLRETSDDRRKNLRIRKTSGSSTGDAEDDVGIPTPPNLC